MENKQSTDLKVLGKDLKPNDPTQDDPAMTGKWTINWDFKGENVSYKKLYKEFFKDSMSGDDSLPTSGSGIVSIEIPDEFLDIKDALAEGKLSGKSTKPQNRRLWKTVIEIAKQKFEKYPSTPANEFASRLYKKKGGMWIHEEASKKPIKWIIGHVDSYGAVHSKVIYVGDVKDSHRQFWPNAHHNKWRWLPTMPKNINTYGDDLEDDSMDRIWSQIDYYTS